jgi:RES domain
LKRRRKGSRRKPPKKGGEPVSYTLDQFNIGDLRTWQRASHAIEEYHLRVFYELEAQRQLYRSEIFNALKEAKHPSLFALERWVRFLDHAYSNQPLSAVGSVRSIGGRFNVGEDLSRILAPFHALYLAEDPDTACREYLGLAMNESRGRLTPRDLALTPKKSFSCVRVSGVVANLLDITDPKRLKPFCDAIAKFVINSDSQELIRSTTLSPMTVIQTPQVLMETLLSLRWRELGMQLGIPSNSQVFGRIVFEAGYDGIVFKSARGAGRCLCIFLENLTHSETVLKLPDPAPSLDTVTELSATTWAKLVTPSNLKRAASRLPAALH